MESTRLQRDQEWWIAAYRKKGAYWTHDDNPSRPHAELTSGEHSSGFFNSRLVIPDEELLTKAAIDLVELLLMEGIELGKIDRVVGPQTGATKLAELVAAEVTDTVGDPNFVCKWASPAKAGEGPDKHMVFDDPERSVLPGETVLLVEDVLTSGGSVELTAKAVEQCGGRVLPFVLVLVNRSGEEAVDNRKVLPLIFKHMPKWKPGSDSCPLCKLGSAAVRPKGPTEWAQLNATY